MKFDILAAVSRVLRARTGNLKKLAEAAGLDPTYLFIGTSMDGVDLSGQDLSGMVFTHLDLTKCPHDSKTIIDQGLLPPSIGIANVTVTAQGKCASIAQKTPAITGVTWLSQEEARDVQLGKFNTTLNCHLRDVSELFLLDTIPTGFEVVIIRARKAWPGKAQFLKIMEARLLLKYRYACVLINDNDLPHLLHFLSRTFSARKKQIDIPHFCVFIHERKPRSTKDGEFAVNLMTRLRISSLLGQKAVAFCGKSSQADKMVFHFMGIDLREWQHNGVSVFVYPFEAYRRITDILSDISLLIMQINGWRTDPESSTRWRAHRSGRSYELLWAEKSNARPLSYLFLGPRSVGSHIGILVVVAALRSEDFVEGLVRGVLFLTPPDLLVLDEGPSSLWKCVCKRGSQVFRSGRGTQIQLLRFMAENLKGGQLIWRVFSGNGSPRRLKVRVYPREARWVMEFLADHTDQPIGVFVVWFEDEPWIEEVPWDDRLASR